MPPIETIFFDLDGTLTDPKDGITKSIQYALEQMGVISPPHDKLTHLIGPPLSYYFSEMLGADKVTAAIVHYRQRYDVDGLCLTKNLVYPGIEIVLADLQRQGKKLFVVSAKPQILAEKIIRHFNLSRYFHHVYGAEADETRSHKDELIAHVLEQEKLSPKTAVMIGDRKYDIEGANANGVSSIGVLWGYGSHEELQAANPSAIAKCPGELLQILSNLNRG
jgi:phosphoglycolate phosphatase